jgi:hypothetical protein
MRYAGVNALRASPESNPLGRGSHQRVSRGITRRSLAAAADGEEKRVIEASPSMEPSVNCLESPCLPKLVAGSYFSANLSCVVNTRKNYCPQEVMHRSMARIESALELLAYLRSGFPEEMASRLRAECSKRLLWRIRRASGDKREARIFPRICEF